MSDAPKPAQGRGPLPTRYPHEPERIRKGAELIAAMRRKEIEIPGEVGLPEDAYPRNIDEAQLMADMVADILGWPIRGYKYYINARIQQAPMMSPIYHIWDSPAVLSEEDSQHRWIEPELAFRTIRDFPAREQPYSYQEIIEGVEAVPVFEIIGPRFRFDSPQHMRALVNSRRDNPKFDGMADSHASGGYVVGKAVEEWKDFDWLAMRVTMDAGNARMVDTVGGHPLVDPFISSVPLINTLRRKNGVAAGQLLASHSYSGFLSVPADVPVVSTFSYFDPIEAIFQSKKGLTMPFGQVRDIEVYYEIVGSGPRLLFINGTNADLRRRQPYVDSLNDHFTVLRFDQRGLGQSGKPDQHYSMADYADDAAALMDLVGWDKAAVLGVSFGGSVAQELARRHPERITRMVLACANPGGDYAYPLLDLNQKDPETRARTMLSLDLRKSEEWQAAHPEEAEKLLAMGRKRGAPVDPSDPHAAMGARRQLEAREEHDALGWIDQIRVPVALFGGRYDGLGTEAGQHAMFERIPGSILRIFEGAHGFLNEDPEAVPAVVAFLTKDATA